MPTMENELKIEFRLLVGEDQVSVEELLKNPDSLLNAYLAEEAPTDSVFQGGYCISVGDKKWNGKEEFYFDMFSYTLNWLSGIEKILLKELTSAEVGFWEESTATAALIGSNELKITDTHVGGKIVAKPTIVNFGIFCHLLLQESRKYEQLAHTIKNNVLAKGEAIDKKRGEQIIREMCADDFSRHCKAIEILLKEQSNLF